MTTYHRECTAPAWAITMAARITGQCSCDEAWTGRGLCSEDCGWCQYGQDFADLLASFTHRPEDES